MQNVAKRQTSICDGFLCGPSFTICPSRTEACRQCTHVRPSRWRRTLAVPRRRPPTRRCVADDGVAERAQTNHRGPRDEDSPDSEADDDQLEFDVTYLTEIDHIDKGLKRTVWMLCALGLVADRGTPSFA